MLALLRALLLYVDRHYYWLAGLILLQSVQIFIITHLKLSKVYNIQMECIK